MTGSRKSFGCGLVNRIRSIAVDGVASAQQLTELGADRGCEVAAPRVDVLTEQRDLADAARGEAGDLRDDVARAPALLAPSHRRDDAVGALRVAAHRHLHPRLEPPLGVEREICRRSARACRTGRVGSRTRRRRSIRPDAGSSRGRKRRRRTGTGRRFAHAAPRRSTRRRRPRRRGARASSLPRSRDRRPASCPVSRGSCRC